MNLEQYLKAWGSAFNDARSEHLPSEKNYSLAYMAYQYTRSIYRLADMSQSIDANNTLRMAAQKADVDGWLAKTNRYIGGSQGWRTVFDEMVRDFSEAASSAREPDEEERAFMALGQAGRIGEVVVRPVVEPYSWEDPTNAFESSFTKRQ